MYGIKKYCLNSLFTCFLVFFLVCLIACLSVCNCLLSCLLLNCSLSFFCVLVTASLLFLLACNCLLACVLMFACLHACCFTLLLVFTLSLPFFSYCFIHFASILSEIQRIKHPQRNRQSNFFLKFVVLIEERVECLRH